MRAVALSDSVQQSSRCKGLQIMRLASTSSTVTRFLYKALGLLEACSLCATFTAATCSGVVPYSNMWRMKLGANIWPALRWP